jgi:hypothetical protein
MKCSLSHFCRALNELSNGKKNFLSAVFIRIKSAKKQT